MKKAAKISGKSHIAIPDMPKYLFFFVIGLILGTMTAYLLRNSLYTSLFHIYSTLLGNLQTLEIDLSSFFTLALERHGRYLLFLYLFGFTNIWRYYFRLFLAYAGLQNGLLLAFCLQMNGIAGIVGYFCFLLPHAILLAPAYLITIQNINQLHQSWYNTDLKRKQLLWIHLPALLASIILLLSGCLLEAAFNPELLRMFFR